MVPTIKGLYLNAGQNVQTTHFHKYLHQHGFMWTMNCS